MCEYVFKTDFLEENEPLFHLQFLLPLQRKNVGPMLYTARTRDGGQRLKLDMKAPIQHHGAKRSRGTGKIPQ